MFQMATSLLEAAKSGNIIQLRHLLTFGQWHDINAYNSLPGQCGEWTPLMVASMNGHVDCVHELLNHGADVTYFNSDGDYSLHLAAKHGHAQCIEGLIGHQAGVNQQNTFSGRTALMDAIENQHLSCVETLLRHHANVNIQTYETKTSALMMACACDFLEAIPILLSYGADENLVNCDGETAHTIAEKNGRIRCIMALLRIEDFTVNAAIQDNTTDKQKQKVANDSGKEHSRDTSMEAVGNSSQEVKSVNDRKEKCDDEGKTSKREAQVKAMQFLHAVSKIISNDERLYDIGISLDFLPEEIDAIRTDNRDSIIMASFTLLREWRTRMETYEIQTLTERLIPAFKQNKLEGSFRKVSEIYDSGEDIKCNYPQKCRRFRCSMLNIQ